MYQEEIQRQIDARKRLNPNTVRTQQVIHITQLIASRALAERRNDHKEANRLKEQLLALGVHPSTGQPLGEEEDEEAIREEEERIKEEKAEKKRKALLNQQAIAALKKRTEEDRVKKEREYAFPFSHPGHLSSRQLSDGLD
jgi:RNA polymerase-associated protein RTF1